MENPPPSSEPTINQPIPSNPLEEDVNELLFIPTLSDKSLLIPMDKSKNYGTLTEPILPVERIDYMWKGIDVFCEAPQIASNSLLSYVKQLCGRGRQKFTAEKHLLKNVCGIAKSGELLAIMGGSGAGKTTLLNTLAFRSPPGVKLSSGAIRALNGISVDATMLRSRCAYVQQDDLFIGSLTAREHLIFQAIVRMDRHIPFQQKLNRVDDVITELLLRKCENTIIGTPGVTKGLSGGERKRLALASETLTDPQLLLCDEPTSGLDSFMANSIVQVLKGLAKRGKTIIVTIHQPSSELFALFDKILFMAESRVAFLGTTQQASEFFTHQGLPCPSNYNPADFYVQQLAIAPNSELECSINIRRICDAFAVSSYAEEVNQQLVIHHSGSIYRLDSVKQGFKATWWTQLWALLWRSWLSVLKEPLLIKTRMLHTVTVALIIGLIFYGQALTQDGVMNINGAMFLFLTNMAFQNTYAVANVFCVELPIFLRESKARLYRTDAYFLGKTLAELPLFLIAVPFAFTALAYPMVGLQPTWGHFFNAFVIISLFTNVSASFGYLISCASPTINVALSVGPTVIMPFIMFGGFFLNTGSIPKYLEWLSYFSWFRYGNEALLINQWNDVAPGQIICNRLNSTCPASGHVILKALNFSPNHFLMDILALVALMVFVRLLAFIALYIRARSKE